MRQAALERKTAETDIRVEVNLDGTGVYQIETGCGFFDHMLAQLSRHGLIDMKIKAAGDLHVDAHHLVEDVGITLGLAVAKAAGTKTGITRYGFSCIPMDEALTRSVIDLSGRSCLVWRVAFKTEKVGELDTEVFREFFAAMAQNMAAAIHIENFYGENSHHIAESCFKAFARSLRAALETDTRVPHALPSTKGAL
jgi:imidazoleglycerol-phosphate dehydratase